MNLLSDDPVFRRRARMTPAVPDEAHSARVRARCHAALARQRRNASADARAGRRRYIEFAGIGTFAFVYVLVVVHDMLASYGVLAAAR